MKVQDAKVVGMLVTDVRAWIDSSQHSVMQKGVCWSDEDVTYRWAFKDGKYVCWVYIDGVRVA